MAFTKKLQMDTGDTAEYIRLVSYRWDRATREASALFAVYRDKAAAESGAAPYRQGIKLRLKDAAFDKHLGNTNAKGADTIARLYAAAKSEPVVCDFGSAALADAADA